MNTNDKIKALRKQKRLSQDALAQLTGYTDRSSIAKIEAGKVDLTESKLLAFAKALDVSPSYLMGLSDTPVSSSLMDPSPLTLDQVDLLSNYNQLNNQGKDELRRHARVMVLSGEYDEERHQSVLDAGA